MRLLVMILCLWLCLPSVSLAAAEGEGGELNNLVGDKIITREKVITVTGGLNGGDFKHVSFETPTDSLLVGLDVEVVSRFPDAGNPLLIQSVTGWRLVELDKFREYVSANQPQTKFAIEAWAHKYGFWYEPKSAEIQLKVSWAYYKLIDVSQDEFNDAVQMTLDNIHPIPVHQSAIDAYSQMKRDGSFERVKEALLRADRSCLWGASPNCSDCLLHRSSKTGEEISIYIYNAYRSEGFCQ